MRRTSVCVPFLPADGAGRYAGDRLDFGDCFPVDDAELLEISKEAFTALLGLRDDIPQVIANGSGEKPSLLGNTFSMVIFPLFYAFS